MELGGAMALWATRSTPRPVTMYIVGWKQHVCSGLWLRLAFRRHSREWRQGVETSNAASGM